MFKTLNAFLATLLCVATVSVLIGVAHGTNTDRELDIHVVPFTHVDPGWWWPFETYYTKWTRGIITTVINKLADDPSRRFIWEEISFFERWWQEQDQLMQHKVRKLIANGQLEFTYGGWVMNDEAGPHYSEMIDQLTVGHLWLLETFSVKPNVSFSNDPFGHASTQAFLFKLAGFDAMFINRIPKDEKQKRRDEKTLEYVWLQEWDSSPHDGIFTHINAYKLYDIPNTCGPSWTICRKYDFETKEAILITDGNVKERADTLMEQYRIQAEFFRHNNLLIILGDDFKYKNPAITDPVFDNYEKLFKYINAQRGSYKANIHWSTLSDYFRNVYQASVPEQMGSNKVSFPTFIGDFFTYNDEGDDYWSGYYTTRPKLKLLIRQTNQLIRHAEQLFVEARAKGLLVASEHSSMYDDLQVARQDAALALHHDAITGTSAVDVINDYMFRLRKGGATAASISAKLTALVVTDSDTLESNSKKAAIDLSSDVGIIDIVSRKSDIVTLRNSLAVRRSYIATIRTNSASLRLKSLGGAPLEYQIIQIKDQQYDVMFLADVPALGTRTYSLELVDVAPKDVITNPVPVPKGEFELKGEAWTLKFNADGSLKDSSSLQHGLFDYTSSQKGGAYLFQPQGDATEIPVDRSAAIYSVTGHLVSYVEVRHVKSKVVRWIIHHKGDMTDLLQVDLTFDISGQRNVEFVTRFQPPFDAKGVFYTDKNGLGDIKRTWNSKKPLPANYYPTTTGIYVTDVAREQQFGVLTTHAMGATLLPNGAIEIALDRQLSQDDGRGLGQGVTDSIPMTVSMFLFRHSPIHIHPVTGHYSTMVNNPPMIFLAVAPANVDIQISSSTSFLQDSLPPNVHIQSLRARSNDIRTGAEVILRLVNLEYRGMVEVISLQDLFNGVAMDDLTEMSLTTLFDSSREAEEYPVEGHDSRLSTFKQRQDHVRTIALSRMSLRTFVTKLSLSKVGATTSTTRKVIVPLDETEYLKSGKRAPEYNYVDNNNNNNGPRLDSTPQKKQQQQSEPSSGDCDSWKAKATKAEIERIKVVEVATKYRTESDRWKDKALLNRHETLGGAQDGVAGTMSLVMILPLATLAIVGAGYYFIRRAKNEKRKD